MQDAKTDPVAEEIRVRLAVETKLHAAIRAALAQGNVPVEG